MTHQTAAEILRQATADLSPTALRAFHKIGIAGGWTAETLVDQPDAVDTLKRQARAVADLISQDVVNVVGEDLLDAAHEHCGDEGCTGGGRVWCDAVAKLLVDPYGPLAEIGSELHRIHDQAAEDLSPLDARELVGQRFGAWIASTADGERAAIVRLAASLAVLVEATDRAEAERLRRMAASAEGSPS